MSVVPNDSQRLRRLEQILAVSRPVQAAAGDGRDRADRDLERASLDRIRQITAELQTRHGSAADDIDALAARLLLNDYAAVVARMRGIARDAGARIDASSESVREVRRFLWRDEKLREEAQQALGEPLDAAR